MLNKWRKNEQGLLMYFVVLVMCVLVVGIMWFFFANAIQTVQESVNPLLGNSSFASQANYNTFNLANTFMNNLWLFFLVFLVLGLAYYGYVEAQRRR